MLAEVLVEAKERAGNEMHIEYPSKMHVAEAFPVQSNIIKGSLFSCFLAITEYHS